MASRIKWIDSEKFDIGGILFRTINSNYKDSFTSDSEVIIIKPKRMLDWYENLIKLLDPHNILEFGIFQGGSEILILSLSEHARLLAIDLEPAIEPLERIIRRQGWDDRAKLHFETSQDDVDAVNAAIDAHFGGEKLDLVIDDASHLYAPSRRAFEIAFPRLRPGGVYVIEDWGWANWPGNWQAADGQWCNQPALTNLIFELVMVAASRPDLIAGIEIVSRDVIAIWRGDWINDDCPFNLSEHYVNRGKILQLI